MSKKRTSKLVELALQNPAETTPKKRQRVATVVSSEQRRRKRADLGLTLPDASEDVAKEDSSHIVFLLDINTVLTWTTEAIETFVFKTLAVHHAKAETNAAKRHCKTKKILWAYRIFDTSEHGCTPAELDRILGKPRKSMFYFRQYSLEEVEAFSLSLKDYRERFERWEKERPLSSSGELGSAKLTLYELFSSSVDQTLANLNWDDHSDDIFSTTSDLQDHIATNENSVIVLCPAPQTRALLEDFAVKRTSISATLRVTSTAVEETSPRTLHTKVEQSFEFFHKYQKQYSTSLTWVDSSRDQRNEDFGEEGATSIIHSVLKSMFCGRVIPLASITNQAAIIPFYGFPEPQAQSDAYEAGLHTDFVSAESSNSLICPSPTRSICPSPVSATFQKLKSVSSPISNTLNRSNSIRSISSVSTPTYPFPPAGSTRTSALTRSGSIPKSSTSRMEPDSSTKGELICKISDSEGIVLPIKVCDFALQRSFSMENREGETTVSNHIQILIEGSCDRSQISLDSLSQPGNTDEPLLLCFAASSLEYGGFAQLLTQLHESRRVACGVVSGGDDNLQLAILLIPLAKHVAMISPQGPMEVVDRIFGTPTGPSTVGTNFIPASNLQVLSSTFEDYKMERFSHVGENLNGHSALIQNWLDGTSTPSGLFAERNYGDFDEDTSELESECAKLAVKLEQGWTLQDESEEEANETRRSSVGLSPERSTSPEPEPQVLPQKRKTTSDESELSYDSVVLSVSESKENLVSKTVLDLLSARISEERRRLTVKSWFGASKKNKTSIVRKHSSDHLKTQVVLRLWYLTQGQKKQELLKAHLKELKRLLTSLNLSLPKATFHTFVKSNVLDTFLSSLPDTIRNLSRAFDFHDFDEGKEEHNAHAIPVLPEDDGRKLSEECPASEESRGNCENLFELKNSEESESRQTEEESGPQSKAKSRLANEFQVESVVKRKKLDASNVDTLIVERKQYSLNHFTSGLSNVQAFFRQRKNTRTNITPPVTRPTVKSIFDRATSSRCYPEPQSPPRTPTATVIHETPTRSTIAETPLRPTNLWGAPTKNGSIFSAGSLPPTPQIQSAFHPQPTNQKR